MKIIIFGANEIGFMIAQEFYTDNDITVIDDERNKGHSLFGGLVILDGEKFKYFESTPYVPYNQDPTQWKLFDELLK